MKKLVLHIGYPKTASTTLQDGLFLKLHQHKLINFLGRTVASTHVGRKGERFEQDLAVNVRKHFNMGKPLNSNPYNLSDSLINVFSDEDITLHPLLDFARFGIRKDLNVMATTLKRIFSDADEIVILMTIRSQVELIPSCFIQKFRYVYRYIPGFSFSDFIRDENGIFNKETYNAFNFKSVADSFSNIFNSNVSILIFEDLIQDKNTFLDNLGSILNIPAMKLGDILGEQHFRKKEKKSKSGSAKILVPNWLGDLTLKVFGQKKGRHFLDYRWYLKNSAWAGFEQRLFHKKINIKFPEISSSDTLLIKDSFKESNELLAHQYNCDIQKMKKYNYF